MIIIIVPVQFNSGVPVARYIDMNSVAYYNMCHDALKRFSAIVVYSFAVYLFISRTRSGFCELFTKWKPRLHFTLIGRIECEKKKFIEATHCPATDARIWHLARLWHRHTDLLISCNVIYYCCNSFADIFSCNWQELIWKSYMLINCTRKLVLLQLFLQNDHNCKW